MNPRHLTLLALLTIAPAYAQDKYVNWLRDYQEALLQARQSRKPLFVEFRCEA